MKTTRQWHLRLSFILLALLLVGCGPPSGSDDTKPDTTSETPVSTVEGTKEAGGTTREVESATIAGATGATRGDDLALITASSRGDVDEVKSLLERGADVHARDGTGGTTPLIAAAYENNVEVARVLIEAGADVNVKDETQQSAYLISTSEVGDDPRLLDLTLANGADVRSLDSYNGTGLIRAAERGYVRIIQRLLETDIDVDHVNNLGWTALLEAIILGDCGQNHTEVVRLLVEAGADVNLADSAGVTPLQHARQQGCTEIANILENAGAV